MNRRGFFGSLAALAAAPHVAGASDTKRPESVIAQLRVEVGDRVLVCDLSPRWEKSGSDRTKPWNVDGRALTHSASIKIFGAGPNGCDTHFGMGYTMGDLEMASANMSKSGYWTESECSVERLAIDKLFLCKGRVVLGPAVPYIVERLKETSR